MRGGRARPRRRTRTRRASHGSAALAAALLLAFGPTTAAAQDAEPPGSAGEAGGAFAYPGATEQPATAEALRAYYGELARAKDLTRVDVYVTDAPFEEVARFYGERMRGNKWHWSHEEYELRHQAETLAFYRSGALGASRGDGASDAGSGFPEVLSPILGDPALSEDAFAAKLDSLVRTHPGAEIEVGEGSRGIGDAPTSSGLRVMVESPYLDPESMRLVDSTRIQVLRFGGAP